MTALLQGMAGGMRRAAGRVAAVLPFLAAVLLPAGPAWAGSSDPNFIRNASFESVVGAMSNRAETWMTFTSGAIQPELVSTASRTGARCLRLVAQGRAKSFQGITQAIEVVPGERYTFTAYVQSFPIQPLKGGAYGQLVIEWLDGQGLEVARTWGDAWGPRLSRIRWQKISIEKVEVPPGAEKAVFGVHLYDGQGSARGAVLVDDVAVESSSANAQARQKGRRMSIGQQARP